MSVQIAGIDNLDPSQTAVYSIREYPADTQGPNLICFEYGISAAGGGSCTAAFEAEIHFVDRNGNSQVITSSGFISGTVVEARRVPVNLCERQNSSSQFELHINGGGVADGAVGFVRVVMTPADPSSDFQAMTLDLVP